MERKDREDTVGTLKTTLYICRKPLKVFVFTCNNAIYNSLSFAVNYIDYAVSTHKRMCCNGSGVYECHTNCLDFLIMPFNKTADHY